MSCSNCFNGCAEIISDQCVRYTGVDIPILGIQNGDSLSYVEQALITFLTSTLDGSGIKPTIDPNIICNLVQQYLPTCEDLTVTNVLTALIQAACNLQTQVTTNLTSINTINAQIATIEANYDLGCDYITDVTPSVTPSSGTHAVLQATIDALCAFILEVETNYVLTTELDILIANYLANLPTNTLINQKMIPYVAYEYYGSLTNFDAQGTGTGDWIDVYLCNGLNGTPDRRGVVAVGAIASVPGGPLPSATNPASSPFNPNYAFAAPIVGSNSVTLNTNQLPSHTHTNKATATVADTGHTHTFEATNNVDGGPRPNGFVNLNTGGVATYTTGTSSPSGLGLTVTPNVVIDPAGGNLPHANNQPAIAAYYVMYIP